METYTPGDGPETPIMSYILPVFPQRRFLFLGLRSPE